MKTLILGCGYVGVALGADLVRAGHEVFGLRRSLAGADELRAWGIPTARGRHHAAGIPGQTAPPPTIGLSTAPPPPAAGWKPIGPSISMASATFSPGWREHPPQRFVYNQQHSGVYGQTDGSLVDETSPTEPAADTARILVQSEQRLLEAARQGFPAVILRVAGIYGPGRGYWLKQLRRGEATIDGPGTRLLNMIHRDDVAGVIRAALQRSPPGEIFNAVDDEPVSQLAFFQWLAALLHQPLPPSVPEDPTLFRKRGLTNKRLSNLKLKRELSYRFKYPSFREGYAHTDSTEPALRPPGDPARG